MPSESTAQQLLDRLEAPVQEFRFLLERGYRRAHALKAVSEHHQLALRDRNLLERVAFPQAEADARRARLVSSDLLAGRRLIIDGYNQLIGVECLLAGEPLFLADDGLVRDIAAVRGRFARSAATTSAQELIPQLLGRLEVVSVLIVFDHQVSRSGELAASFREALVRRGVAGEATTSRHADRAVRLASSDAVVCTSDRAIIDGAPNAFDLVRHLARERGTPLGRPAPPLVVVPANM